MRAALLASLALGLSLTRCSGCDESPAARGAAPRGGTRLDAGSQDGGGLADAEPEDAAPDAGLDGGATDAGSTPDAGGFDTGPRPDAGFVFLDAGRLDAGRPDAIFPDAAFPDATAFPDAAPPDTGPDAGFAFPDAGPPPGTGDIWLELDYTGAQTPRSPSWSFSSTPGWGASEWAASNASWPEAWDRFNNMSVVNDPVGRSLEIGSGSQLQVMIGLEELLSYQSATVELEGRSRATSSSVNVEVSNPWTGCFDATTLSNDWTADVVTLDLSGCYEVGSGGGVQAVRVGPQNGGTVALIRLRLTLWGARW